LNANLCVVNGIFILDFCLFTILALLVPNSAYYSEIVLKKETRFTGRVSFYLLSKVSF